MMERKRSQEASDGRSSGRRATMTRVAEELRVSSMTISNAYNHPERVSESLREQIFETAERLGYAGPDPVARSLRRQKTNLAGVLYSNPLSYAFDEAALRRRMPTVIADQPLLEDVPFVGIDNESAAREVARHLVDLGHEHFGVVSFSIAAADRAPGIADSRRQRSATLRVTRARLAGYEAVLEAAGLPWKGVPVYECFGSSKGLGREAADALLSQDPPLTAILALSDQLALGVIEAAKERGLSVPEDLSVAGFDDVPEAVTSRPPLTTVHRDHAEKGELAGRLLVAQLREEETEDTDLLPALLVVRGSTGRPPEAS